MTPFGNATVPVAITKGTLSYYGEVAASCGAKAVEWAAGARGAWGFAKRRLRSRASVVLAAAGLVSGYDGFH